jgi:hypothetical protein
MPTIDHKAPDTSAQASQVVSAIKDSSLDTTELEKQVKRVLGKIQNDRIAAATPKEPDWKNLKEQDAYDPRINIPVIDHEIPDYMNMKLKDTEYEVVWASTDQRRIGQLQAEGYEFLKPEHIADGFKVPLLFDSEERYTYQDVVCMRVHKRILYGKRRRGLELSKRQLGNNHRPPSSKIVGTFELGEAPMLDRYSSFYEPEA